LYFSKVIADSSDEERLKTKVLSTAVMCFRHLEKIIQQAFPRLSQNACGGGGCRPPSAARQCLLLRKTRYSEYNIIYRIEKITHVKDLFVELTDMNIT
jgi:hypothetical protein